MNKDKKILEMVKSADPKLAKTLSDVITGKIVKQIRCNSKHCKGRVIGYIYDNGKPQEKMAKGSGLLGIRTRLDGYIGCECLCGNDSRISAQEKGIITAQVPTKSDLNKIYDRIQQKPSKYTRNGGKIEVDNFTIEEI